MSRTRKSDHTYLFFKSIIKFLVVIFIILIPLGIFFMTCRLENITVEGNNHYSKEELIEKVVNKSTDRNTLLLYGRYKYGEVDSIPFVEDVSIEIINKNTAKIHVYEKVIIGCIEHMGGYMYFDSDGYIVESSNEKVDKVPFITGLQFSKIVLYDKLEIPNNDLFLVILNITQLIYKYELDVNTIRFNKENEITLDCGNIKVLLGKRDTYDEQIAELKSLLPNAGNKKIVIDLRTFTEGQDKVIAKPYD
jgi:cell division protein FtsQ